RRVLFGSYVTLEPEQIDPAGPPVIATLGVTLVETTTAGADACGVIGSAHKSFDVITTETTSPSANVVDVKVEPVSPETSTPFTCHWYVGVVPPFVGFAVYVTLEPEQIDPAGPPVIATLGVTLVETTTA